MVAGMFQFLSAFVAGPLAKVMDSRLMLASGLFLYGVGCWSNGDLTHEDAYWEFFWPQALRASALMFCFLPINSLALGTLPPEEVKNASGLYNLMRNLGGAIGLAVANTLMIQWNKGHYAMLREAVTAGSPQAQFLLEGMRERLADAGVADPDLGAIRQLQGLVMREAEVMTINSLFHGLALVFFSALLLMPLVKKVSAGGDGGGGH
jgi:DHA2 family multidrug resistance protein